MSLIDRVQAILLRPKLTWPVIAAESADTASLYTNYIAILAAIPAIAGFIGLSVVGFGGFGISYRVPIVTGLIHMVLGYVLSLVTVFVMSLIVDALAPTFGGTKSPIQALKLVGYAFTSVFVGGIFSIIPSLGILGILTGLYSIYLVYTGVSPLMRCPPEKAGGYTAVVVVCGIVLGIVVGAVLAAIMPSRMGAGLLGAGAGNMTIQTPDGATVNIDGNSMAAMAQRMQAAGERAKLAQNSGDPAAAAKSVGDMMAAVSGGSSTPIAASDLKAMLPATVDGMKQTSMEANGTSAMGLAVSTAKAVYDGDGRSINLSITDTGSLAGMAAMAGWANMTVDKETNGQIEKVYKDGARTVHEEYAKDGSRSEMTVILANGVIVESEGTAVDMGTVKKVLAGVDLGKIETLKRAAK